jgi:HAE1 family hydrophobic/amphiphilic exporter-1
VKDAKDQLAHNRRLVEEGQLAPIDIVAAETQVANFEQSVYEGLNTSRRRECAEESDRTESHDGFGVSRNAG